MSIRCLLAAALVLGGAPAALSADLPAPAAAGLSRTVYGQPRTLGNGMAWTWARLGPDGRPQAIGVTFTDAALTGLPTGVQEAEYYLALPAEVSLPPYNHVAIDWNPHGHIPKGIYTVPHFDFHFYMLSPSQRDQITLTGGNLGYTDLAPPQQFVPAGYIAAPGSEVPRMGQHWANPASPEFHGRPFTHTFIYGFYGGRMAFVEPMVSEAFLESRQSAATPIAQPAAYQQSGYYPTQYVVSYDPARGEHSVALAGLAYRQGAQ